LLTLYRRHTVANCSSTDSQNCTDKRRPCPIWAKGTIDLDSGYIRRRLGTRDWTKAQERLRELETTGAIAKPAPANVKRATIETLQELFVQNKQTENLSYSTRRTKFYSAN